MTIHQNWKCSCNIELVYAGIDDFLLITDDVELSDDYIIEDRRHTGWGFTVSRVDEQVIDRRALSMSINQFLADVGMLAAKVDEVHLGFKPILRIAIYCSSYSLNVNFLSQSIEEINRIHADLQLFVYTFCADRKMADVG